MFPLVEMLWIHKVVCGRDIGDDHACPSKAACMERGPVTKCMQVCTVAEIPCSPGSINAQDLGPLSPSLSEDALGRMRVCCTSTGTCTLRA